MTNKQMTKPNTWFTTNSHFFFADGLLNGDDNLVPLNVYSLFDLSKLSEAILLAEKIVTLPGMGTYNETARKLKDEKILEEIEIKEEIQDIISEVRGQDWFLKIIGQEGLAKVFADIFKINEKTAGKALLDASMWSLEKWESPNWQWFLSNSEAYNMWMKLRTSNKDKYYTQLKAGHVTQDIISETYLRTILYLRVASQIGLNFYPDSIRVPIVAYLNSQFKTEINKHGQLLVMDLEEKNRKKTEGINKKLGFNRYEIEIPSVLSLVIDSCKSKDNFLNTALELRESDKISKLRQHLAELDQALKSDDKDSKDKVKKLLNQEKLALNTEKVSKESLVYDVVPEVLSVVDKPEFAFSPMAVGINLGLKELLKFFKTRRLVFLYDLGKHLDNIVSINKQIFCIFKEELSEREINHFHNLRAWQRNYLLKFA
jgi:hypothetical protein